MSSTHPTRGRIVAAACVAAAVSGMAGASLHAHDFWLEARSYQPSTGALIGLQLLVGEGMLGDPIPRDDASIERFVVRQAGTDAARARTRGRRSRGNRSRSRERTSRRRLPEPSACD